MYARRRCYAAKHDHHSIASMVYDNDTFTPDFADDLSPQKNNESNLITRRGFSIDETEDQKALQNNKCLDDIEAVPEESNMPDENDVWCNKESGINGKSINNYISCASDINNKFLPNISHNARQQIDNDAIISVARPNEEHIRPRRPEGGPVRGRFLPPILAKSMSHDCTEETRDEKRKKNKFLQRSCSEIHTTSPPSNGLPPSNGHPLREDSAALRRKMFQQKRATFSSICSPSNGSINNSSVNNDVGETRCEPSCKAIKKPKDKGRCNKRWLRNKLPRYSTFDEGNVYLTEEDDKFSNIAGETVEGNSGKFMKQLRRLSLVGWVQGRKVECNYSMVKNDYILHETSRRLPPLNERGFSFKTADDQALGLPQPPLRRSSSVPDYLDSLQSTGQCSDDENLDNLYLPRRMAICPGLHVPAMKQLKTYLVLTRLQQYCLT